MTSVEACASNLLIEKYPNLSGDQVGLFYQGKKTSQKQEVGSHGAQRGIAMSILSSVDLFPPPHGLHVCGAYPKFVA